MTVIADEREHRRGLVLGLTFAEILLLLLFLLLLALGSRLQNLEKSRQDIVSERDGLKAVLAETAGGQNISELVARLQSFSILKVEIAELQKEKQDLQRWKTLTDLVKPDDASVHAIEKSLRNAAAINPNDPPEVLERAIAILNRLGQNTQLHQVRPIREMPVEEKHKGAHDWPPIITLSEADGFYFETGSTELSQTFKERLKLDVVAKLREIVDTYKVDIIEVIGHTDEQPFTRRFSNLDSTLVAVLQNNFTSDHLLPADNAGLGLGRAAAVSQLLSRDDRLKGTRVLPLSAGQLVDVGDSISAGGNVRDVKERRRMEIRVRRSERVVTSSAKPSLNGFASVVDGDTIELNSVRVRLWGIDAMEGGQTCTREQAQWDCAKEASDRLRTYIDRELVRCTALDKDPYGRTVAMCSAKGGDLGSWLVRQGLALDYVQFSSGTYRSEQEQAKAEKIGIWRGTFTPPWEWRRGTVRSRASGRSPNDRP